MAVGVVKTFVLIMVIEEADEEPPSLNVARQQFSFLGNPVRKQLSEPLRATGPWRSMGAGRTESWARGAQVKRAAAASMLCNG
jgi:hypothetical protein